MHILKQENDKIPNKECQLKPTEWLSVKNIKSAVFYNSHESIQTIKSMRVFIIGTGLIGGSFALDIQEKYAESRIYGIDHHPAHIQEALCEVEKTAFKLQERALEIFRNFGMRIRYMDPVSHDKHIAYVSHLSHISSFMLGKTVIQKEKNERDIFDMAGSGFESTVRLAKSSPAMWTPIFEQNKHYIIKTLEEYINNLHQFKTLMEKGDFEAIYHEMKETNHIKNILNGIKI